MKPHIFKAPRRQCDSVNLGRRAALLWAGKTLQTIRQSVHHGDNHVITHGQPEAHGGSTTNSSPWLFQIDQAGAGIAANDHMGIVF
jgi:hypothetical protein